MDADAERNAISTALEDRRSCRDAKDRVDLSFEAATTDALQSAITRGCAALHYSGHGHPQCLTFEDGRGGLQPVPPSQLRSLVARRPPKLAVVSACHSRRAADALVEAGCAHVVAVSLDAPLLDAAAVAFTRAFYLALAVGDTVAAAFSVGVEAVAASPRVAGAASDAGKGDKFELLPLGGDHDEAVFPLGRGRGWRIARRGDAAPPAPWPPRRTLPATAPRPPDDFLGREVDAFKVLDALARKRRLTAVVGPHGVGKSALAAFCAEYADARDLFARVLVVRPTLPASLQDLEALLRDAAGPERLSDDESYLLVLDGAEKADPSDVKLFLAKCLDDHTNLCALVSKRTGLDRPEEHVIPLGPLGLKHAARLFARQCPLLHTANDRRKFTSALLTHADAPDVLGAGLPGAIVASAFSASRADLERILSRASASPLPGGASSSSPFTPIRGGGLSSGFSTPVGE